MSIVAGRQITLETAGELVNVPSNPYAKLMYYLACVNVITSIDFDGLTNYKRWASLTQEEKDKIVAYAMIFNPNTLADNNVVVILADDVEAFKDGNEFVKKTDQRLLHVHVPDTLTLDHYHASIAYVMFAKVLWFDRNYFNPLKDIISNSKTITTTTTTAEKTTTSETNYSNYYQYSNSCDCCTVMCCDCDCCDWYCCVGCCCECDECNCWTVLCFILSLLCPPLGIIFIIIGCCTAEQTMRCIASWASIIGTIGYIALFSYMAIAMSDSSDQSNDPYYY